MDKLKSLTFAALILLTTGIASADVIGNYTGNNWDISGTHDKDTYNSLHFYDGNFYITDNSWGSDQQVDKLDTSFNGVNSWSFSQSRINGITSKGSHLYIGERLDTYVDKTDKNGNVQNTIQVSQVGSDDMTGLTWNGTNFFAVDTGQNANRDYGIVYMYDENWNYAGKSWDLQTDLSWNEGYFEFHNGSFFMAENDMIRRYDQSFNVIETKNISSETRGAKGITVRNDKIYVRTGQSPKIVHEYNYTNSSTTSDNNLPNTNILSPKNTNIKPSKAVLEVEALEPDNENMNISFYDSSGHSQIGNKIENVGNGTYSVEWSGLSEDQTYNWYANITDGSDTAKSATASFTTIGVTLNWNDNSNNEDGFRIYSNASGSLTEVATTTSNTEAYIDYSSNLEFGKNYTYKLSSYNQYGESDKVTDYVVP